LGDGHHHQSIHLDWWWIALRFYNQSISILGHVIAVNQICVKPWWLFLAIKHH
jgi:hypothetical protein